MQKVYLLLRNNQQTGPHSLDDLAEMGLKNSDLIWIEGKSAGWYYPYEVNDLKPLLSTTAVRSEQPPANGNSKSSAPVIETKYQAPKKIFVSLPGNTRSKPAPVAKKSDNDYMEHRAELLRKKVQSVPLEKPEAPSAQQEVPAVPEQIHIEPPFVQKEIAPVPTEIIIDEIPTFYSQKVATEDPAPVAGEAPPKIELQEANEGYVQKRTVSEALVVETPRSKEGEENTYAAGFSIAKPQKKSNTLANKLAGIAVIVLFLAGGWWLYKSFAGKKEQSQVAQQTTPVKLPEQQAATPTEIVAENNLANETTENPVDLLQEKASITEKPRSTQKKVIQDKKTNALQTIPVNTNQVEQKNEATPIVMQEEKKVEEKQTDVVAPENEKKPTFFQKVSGLFKKKKKEEVDPVNPGTTNSNGQRTSTRRDGTDNSNVGSSNISDHLDVKINTSENKWMIGVQGLKLTIHNRSNQVLKKAAVDVIYYNDQNVVIEKKTIYFSNVAPRKSQTVVAPDHQYADHAGYRIVTAVGEGS